MIEHDFDLDKYRSEQARARALGMEYAQIHTIILSVGADGDEGISESRAVELVREMALRAVDRAVAEERAAVVALLQRGQIGWMEPCCTFTLRESWNAIERGEHRREEGA